MDLLLQRSDLEPQRTFGRLMHGIKVLSWCLEDRVREVSTASGWQWKREYKVPGQTAIPSGHYELQITHSNRFNRELPLLLNVPDFSGIRMHAGNTEEDTEGCILVGKGIVNHKLVSSQLALYDLMQFLFTVKGKVFVEVRNP